MRITARIAALVILFTASALLAEESPKSESKMIANWSGDLFLAKYKNREFVIGTKTGFNGEFPLVGTRTLAKPVYADSVFPMTIQEQTSYVVYDRTQQKYIVYNIALCLKGKDKETNEKSDWVGLITASGKQWQADIIVLRKYDKKGGSMRAPYYSMGRNFPMTLDADGTTRVDYNYFGEVVLKPTASEVDLNIFRKIIDDFDQHYSLRDNVEH